MATEELLEGLQAWQLRVFAAGCAYRVAPLIEASGNDRERWTWREALGVLLDLDAPPAPEVCAPLWQRLETVQRDRSPSTSSSVQRPGSCGTPCMRVTRIWPRCPAGR